MKKLNKPFLVRLALLLGGIAVASKVIAAKKEQWQGLSESEVRNKVASKMPDRVPEEKQAAVADKVVGTMRSRGLLTDDHTAPDTADALDDETTDGAQSGDETSA